MVNKKVFNYKLPICDTNILINFELVGVLNEYINHKNGIHISDFIEKEMINKFEASKEYEFMLKAMNENNQINIIKKNEYFTESRLSVINAVLNEFGLKNNAFLLDELCPNIGEFVNALYACNLGIREFVSHDMKFINEYQKEAAFKNLKMKNMVQALDSFKSKDERKEIMKKIKYENTAMVQSLQNEKLLRREIEKWIKKTRT